MGGESDVSIPHDTSREIASLCAVAVNLVQASLWCRESTTVSIVWIVGIKQVHCVGVTFVEDWLRLCQCTNSIN